MIERLTDSQIATMTALMPEELERLAADLLRVADAVSAHPMNDLRVLYQRLDEIFNLIHPRAGRPDWAQPAYEHWQNIQDLQGPCRLASRAILALLRSLSASAEGGWRFDMENAPEGELLLLYTKRGDFWFGLKPRNPAYDPNNQIIAWQRPRSPQLHINTERTCRMTPRPYAGEEG
jgi:hypothetical protein